MTTNQPLLSPPSQNKLHREACQAGNDRQKMATVCARQECVANNKWLSALFFIAGAFALISLRWIAATNKHINSDETQHLHISWAWHNGLTAYKDLFDNHTPLFHILYAPIYGLFGETPDIVFLMRLSTIPLYLAAIYLTYAIAKELFDKRIGLYAAALTAIYPRFFLIMAEFRADDLWLVLWLTSCLLYVKNRDKIETNYIFGFVVGAMFCVSMKSILLIACLVGASSASYVLGYRTENNHKARDIVAFVSGLATLPVVLLSYLASHDALGHFINQAILHNAPTHPDYLKRLISAAPYLSVYLILAAVAWKANHSPSRQQTSRRTTLLIWLTFFIPGIYIFWPWMTAQTTIPAIPIAAIFFTSAISQIPARLNYRSVSLSAVALIIAALFEVSALIPNLSAQSDKNAKPENDLLKAVLSLTDKSDKVFDLKGETIFRQRAYFPVLETITRENVQRNPELDTIAEDVVAQKAVVAIPDAPRIPPRGRQFLNDHYVQVGPVRVPGKTWPAPLPTGLLKVEIVIPGEYGLVNANGLVKASIDGVTADWPVYLSQGEHTVFVAPNTSGPLVLVWNRALEHDYLPSIF
ncbi:ArnT family glycosyltransferase [Methylogaea oryzae]|uniref:ArnT family glycosyltransferase n=1 Tax=Methylogaea oryzae TaxID=1295382 RepID=UPI00138F6CF9|nr:glycosyltransferase family 39 protein [Methylogaea oryzae]